MNGRVREKNLNKEGCSKKSFIEFFSYEWFFLKQSVPFNVFPSKAIIIIAVKLTLIAGLSRTIAICNQLVNQRCRQKSLEDNFA